MSELSRRTPVIEPMRITRRRRLLAKVRVLLRRGTYEDHIILSGPVAYWRLGKGAGTDG